MRLQSLLVHPMRLLSSKKPASISHWPTRISRMQLSSTSSITDEGHLFAQREKVAKQELFDELFSICSPGDYSCVEGAILDSKQDGRKLWDMDPFSRSNCRSKTKGFVSRGKIYGKNFNQWSYYQREALMITTAAKDQGQSIQQHYNMVDFVNATKGIAIETSFGFDQKDFWGEICKTSLEFERAIAYRIFHRLVEHHKGSAFAHESFGKECDPKIRKLICKLKSPVLFALQTTRKMMGVADDTKLLLVVDEIDRAFKKKASSLIGNGLWRLLDIMSSDEAVFASVTSLSCDDFFWFVANNKGRDYVQTLHPNLFYIDDANVPLLPYLLQQFFDADKKKLLRFSAGDKVQYSRLARLVLEAGAHPKTLSVLLEQLRLFPGHVVGSDKNFSKCLRTFLDENLDGIRVALAQVDIADVNVDLEVLAKDCANSFGSAYDVDFITRPGVNPYHEPFCAANKESNCQFIPIGSMTGNAFLPMSTLKQINNSHPTASGPCLTALMQLYSSLDLFVDQKLSGKTGNAWQGVVAASLLLYARSDVYLQITDLTVGRDDESLNEDFMAGPSVQYWDDVGPIKRGSARTQQSLVSQFTSVVRRLKDTPSCEGAVFLSDASRTGVGDVYGLFRGDDCFVLVVMECRDVVWGRKPITTTRPVDYSRSPRDILVDGVRLKRMLSLCSPDEFKDAITLEDMSTWLPTTSYACQAAIRIGEIFGPDRRTPAERIATDGM